MHANEGGLPRVTAAGETGGWSVTKAALASIRRVAGRIALAMERSQQRRALAALSDHQLRDIGLTREAVLRGRGTAPWQNDVPSGKSAPAPSNDDWRHAA